jgi:cell division GTPase FtsZ
VEVKVIGFGSRGSSAISKLVAHGKVRLSPAMFCLATHIFCCRGQAHAAASANSQGSLCECFECCPFLQVTAAELWCLDVDRAALDAAPTPNTLLLPKEDAANGVLSAADLQRIVGRAASDAGGRGNINAGTDGAVTFVLAPAAAPPGGAATVLQIVQAMRAAGHFTVAAVTRPFAFEGPAKQDQVGGRCTRGKQAFRGLPLGGAVDALVTSLIASTCFLVCQCRPAS